MKGAVNNILRLTAASTACAARSFLFTFARNIYYTRRTAIARQFARDIGAFAHGRVIKFAQPGKCRAIYALQGPIMPDVKFVYFTGRLAS